jgi:hypothetical protein
VDEQALFRELLQAARALLPAPVAVTCESLDEHGEWELALSHCRYYLEASGTALPEAVAVLVAACEDRFRSGAGAS